MRKLVRMATLANLGISLLCGCSSPASQDSLLGAQAQFYLYDGRLWGLEIDAAPTPLIISPTQAIVTSAQGRTPLASVGVGAPQVGEIMKEPAAPVLVTELPERIDDAIVMRDSVVAMTKSGLFRIHRSSGKIDPIATFSGIGGGGNLLSIDNELAGFSWLDRARSSTLIGVIDMMNWRVSSCVMNSGIFSIVGISHGRGQVLLQPKGQDPSYGELIMVDTKSCLPNGGSVVRGYGTAAVSADGSRVVTADMIRDGKESHTELREYVWGQGQWYQRHSVRITRELYEQLQFVWNRSGTEIFFLTRGPKIEPAPESVNTTYIWHWRGGNDDPEPVTPPLPQEATLVAMSTSESSWLVSGGTHDQWHLVYETGDVKTFTLPTGSRIVPSASWRLAR